LFADEPLVHAVSKLEEFGYGRLPVLDRGEIRSSGWSQRAISSRDCFRSCRSIIMKKRSIATYEAEMNVIIYADEGRVDVNIEPDVIRIEVRDRGQGIADVERAIEPGYSTAPDWVRELGFGAGMGLPNIRNCARDFDLVSTVGRGTTLRIVIPTGMEEKRCA